MITAEAQERIRAWIGEDDAEGSACRDIPEESCSEVPRNVLLNAANGALTKLAEQIASPGVVLPWLLGALGAPVALVGWLVPVRQAGSLLPQMATAGIIRGFPRRKGFWAAAGAVQAATLLAMGAVAGLGGGGPGPGAGLAVVGLLAVFSLASGVGSVAFTDVMGKTIPKGVRGRLLALRATVGGALALLAGLAMRSALRGSESPDDYVVLLAVAAALWAAAAVLFALQREPAGATGGGASALQRSVEGFRLLRRSAALRRFVLVRALLLPADLALPFYALTVREALGTGSAGLLGKLGLLVLAMSLANIVSSLVWGRLADRSARATLSLAGGLAAAVGLAFALAGLRPGLLEAAWPFAVLFFLAGVAQSGVRLGRKTWILDTAPAELKATWTALANTLIGALTLAAGTLGLLHGVLGPAGLIALLAALAAAGALLASRLPDDPGD